MGIVHVRGYTRINPKTGNREHVDGYTYTRKSGGRHSSLTQAFKEKKRESLLPDGVPTKDTQGWEMRRSPQGHSYLGMTDPTYDRWLQNTITKARNALNKQGTTQHRFKTVNHGKKYTPERAAQQEKVIQTFFDRAVNTPKEHKAVMTGGRPGAGKTRSLDAQHITDDRYFTVDSDKVKEEMIAQGMAPDIPGLTPFEAAGLIHRESTDIADEIVNRLSAQGTNVVVDGTMAWAPYIKQRAEHLHDLGYKIKGLYVDVSPETSKRRTLARHRRGVEAFLTTGRGWGGRYVDPTVNARSVQNRKVFDQTKRLFDGWVIYDNDKDDRTPVLLDSSHAKVEFSRSEPVETERGAGYYLALLAGGA